MRFVSFVTNYLQYLRFQLHHQIILQMTERLPSGVRFNITYTRYDSLFSSLIRGFFLEILCYFSLLKNQRLKFLFNLESMG